MPSQSKPVIAIFTGPQGHYSIAAAIRETLESKYTIVEYYNRDSLFKAYIPVYQLLPVAFQLPFKLAKQKTAQQSLYRFFLFKYQNLIENFIQKHQPVLCINTFFMYGPALEKLCNAHNIPLLNILTDPRTFHPTLLLEDATVNIGFDHQTIKRAKTFNKNAVCQAFGWYVKKQFEQDYDKEVVRKKLKLKTDCLTFLIASGSEGTSLILKILPAFTQSETPVQVVIACGNNKTLFRITLSLSKVIQKTNPLVKLIPLRFKNNIHEYMQASNLVIGKAGPNTIFESVATHVPFLAITHIAGQEDGNLDLIKDYRIGYVEEHSVRAFKLLQNITRNPAQLDRFQKSIAQLAKINLLAKEKLVFLVDQLVAKS